MRDEEMVKERWVNKKNDGMIHGRPAESEKVKEKREKGEKKRQRKRIRAGKQRRATAPEKLNERRTKMRKSELLII